jgi:hypothetical protein
METTEPLTSTIPRYVINLNASPAERWRAVVEDYKHLFPEITQYVQAMIKEVAGEKYAGLIQTALSAAFSLFTKTGLVYYSEELKAISQQCDLPLGLLALVQISYELFANCTTIIREGHDGVPIMVRSMDWGLKFLEKLTVEYDFQYNGTTVFVATSWAGYVGILTGMRPGGYSLAINFRSLGESPWKNISKMITRGWPVGFLMRKVLEEDIDYETAVGSLSCSTLIAPTYISVCGVRPGEGVIITRNREGLAHELVTLENIRTKNYMFSEVDTLVQVNCDWWISNDDLEDSDNILLSRERRVKALKKLKRMRKVDVDSMLTLYEEHPIQNSLTIYYCAMVPATGFLYSTCPNI